MKLLTLNIWNYTRPWPVRRSLIAHLIGELQPDVVGLQETRHDFRFERGRGQGEQIAELVGYVPTSAVAQVYVPLLRIDEGLTVLTREPPVESTVLRLARLPRERADENQRICIGVTVPGKGGLVDVYDTHFSLSAAARLSNAREVKAFILQRSADRPYVLMGDLNAHPDSPPIQALTEDGLIDCWTAIHPDSPGFTDESWKPRQRIDYMMAGNLPNFPSRAELVGRDAADGVYLSDHLGLLVEVDL